MKITNYIVHQIFSLGLAKENFSPEVYTYGINTGINIIINFLTTIIISILLDKTVFCIEFFIFFIPLRSTCGGFHFSSPKKCFFVSTIIFSIILQYQILFYKNFIFSLGIAFFSTILFFLFPVKGSNVRKLSLKDILYFEKRKKKLIYLYLIIIFILLLLSKKRYITPIISAIILAALLIIIDFVISSKRKKIANSNF